MNIGEIYGRIGAADWSAGRGETPANLSQADRRELLSAIPDAKLPGVQESSQINLDYDKELGETIVRITDRRSGETLLQIPGKDVLERARYYRELEKL